MLHYILCTTSFFSIFVFKNCDDIFFKCTSWKYLVFRLKSVFVVREWLPTNRQIIHNFFFIFFFLGNPCDTSSLYTVYVAFDLKSSIESGRELNDYVVSSA